jgi:hypothetical protein
VSERAVETSIAEAEAVATLHELNAEYIRAFVESDVERYREQLSEDFVVRSRTGGALAKTTSCSEPRKGPA